MVAAELILASDSLARRSTRPGGMPTVTDRAAAGRCRTGSLIGAIMILAAGPAPLAAAVGQWTSIGPDGAWVSDLEIAPSNPLLIYAVVQVSGVFKSEDGGHSWVAVNRGLPDLDLPNGGAFALAIDPFVPSVVYAATSRGIYKSTDGGGRWFPSGFFAGRLICDPEVPDTIYAGSFSSGTVWVSRDGGSHWEVAESLPGITEVWLVTDPGHGLIYALGRRVDNVFRLHVSGDHGRTWRDLSAALPSPTLSPYGPRIDQGQIAIDPGSPGALYLAYPGNVFEGILPATYQSTDLGHSWHAVGPGGFPIAVGPNHAIYAGTVRSLDFGRTWTPTAPFPEPVNCLVAGGNALYAGGETLGVVRSTDGAESWQVSSAGLRADDIVAFTLDPTNPAKIFAYTPSGALVASTDGGLRWRGAPAIGLCVPPGACGISELASESLTLAVDPLNPKTVYFASPDGLQRSTDGGHLVYPLYQPGLGCLGIEVFALDPFVSGTLYGTGTFTSNCSPGAPSQCHAFKSIDFGETWSCLGVDGRIIAVAPSSPGRLYAIGFNAGASQSLYTSADRGDSWELVNKTLPTGVGVLVVDPVDRQRLYLGGSGGDVWSSSDAGKGWRQVLEAEPGPALLAIDPIQPRNLYVALFNVGVLHSADRGLTWQPLTKGLPTLGYIYNQLAADPRRSGTVYLGTVTNAVLEYTLP